MERFKVKEKYSSRVFETCLEQLAEKHLDGSDYDQGQLEDLSSTVRKVTAFAGTLLDVLVQKEIISLEEAVSLLQYQLAK